MKTPRKQTTENYIKEIRRNTRRIFSSEQKIQIVMEALKSSKSAIQFVDESLKNDKDVLVLLSIRSIENKDSEDSEDLPF